MNKIISVALALLGLVFIAALFQPHWNPFTVLILVALIATCGWFSLKFWKKDEASDADRT